MVQIVHIVHKAIMIEKNTDPVRIWSVFQIKVLSEEEKSIYICIFNKMTVKTIIPTIHTLLHIFLSKLVKLT